MCLSGSERLFPSQTVYSILCEMFLATAVELIMGTLRLLWHDGERVEEHQSAHGGFEIAD